MIETRADKLALLDEYGFTAEPTQEFAELIPPEEAEEEKKKVTQAENVLRLVDANGADFFHTTEGDLYATIPVSGHIEVWPLDGRDFKTWLHGLYYKDTGKAANNEAVGQAIAVLSAKARFDRPEPVTLSTRTAERNGDIWYDLTNSAWQAVKVTAEGVVVTDNPPIMFTRYRHQSAQVIPQPGGDVRKIWQYINIKSHKILFAVWLISCFVPNIPHAMLILFGEKGAAKSTACEFVKTIIDPSSLSTLTITNDPRSMAVNLQQHYFLPFDNVSYINDETSDTLCRAITGGGIQQRKLFTNSEDAIFTFKRCLAINGINNVATRADLLDRSLLIELERISDDDRRELSEIQAAFEADRAAILGGILETLSKAITIYPTVKLPKLQRMADFTRWGYAIGEALGGLGEQFLSEYGVNRENQNTEAINADPVATLIVEFMSDRKEWDGTVSELYNELTAIAADHNINTRNKYFPSDSARLGKRINGIKSNLEGVGISFFKGRSKHATTIAFRVQDLPTLPTPPTLPSNTNGFSGVGNDGLPTPECFTYTLLTPEKHSNTNESVSSVGSVGKNATFTGNTRRGRI